MSTCESASKLNTDLNLFQIKGTELENQSKQVKSPIQLPKRILKRFGDAEGWFYYYDDSKKRTSAQPLIARINAKSFNTELGYYSSEIEA